MKKYLGEFLGVFFFVTAVLMSTYNGNAGATPWAAAAIWMAVGIALAPISGAHFNPAISLAVFIQKGMDRTDLLYYWFAQMLGATVASVFASFLLSCAGGLEIIPTQHPWICSVLAELIGVCALVLVWIRDQLQPWIRFAASGTALAAMALSLGSGSDWAFNPALTLGRIMMGSLTWQDMMLHLPSAFAGAALACSIQQIFTQDSK